MSGNNNVSVAIPVAEASLLQNEEAESIFSTVLRLLDEQGPLSVTYPMLQAAFKGENDFLSAFGQPETEIYKKKLTIVLHYYLIIPEAFDALTSPFTNEARMELFNNSRLEDLVRHMEICSFNSQWTLEEGGIFYLENFIKNSTPAHPIDAGDPWPNKRIIANFLLNYSDLKSVHGLLLNIALDDESMLHEVLGEENFISDAAQTISVLVRGVFGGRRQRSYLDQIQEKYATVQRELFLPLQNQGYVAIENDLHVLLQRETVASLRS